MKFGKTAHLKNAKPICPSCDKLLDGFTGIDNNATPEPDDITICCYCGSILKFTEKLTVVEMSPLELDNLPKKDFYDIIDAQQAAAQFRDILKESKKTGSKT